MNEGPAPEPPPNEAMQSTAARQEAALRDLIWRVDHVRARLALSNSTSELHELVALLDTSDAHAALGDP